MTADALASLSMLARRNALLRYARECWQAGNHREALCAYGAALRIELTS